VRQMRRREFIAAIGGIVTWPVAAQAQSASAMARIVYLGASGPSSLDPRQIGQFKLGLTENGLVEGRNVTVEYLWAEGSLDRLKQLAGELARRKPDVIVTAGSQAVRTLLGAGVATPIVFAIYGDPTGDGVVDSLSHPGKNLTGLSMADSHLEVKRLEILREAFPALKRVAILHDATSSSSVESLDVQSGGRSLGLECVILEASDPSRFDALFAEAEKQGCNGLAGMASAFLNFHHQRLVDLAMRYRFPAIWEASGYVRDGGLLSYGPNFPDMYRQSGRYVAKILAGARASDLPIEQPVKFELAVNIKTAKTLDLTVPPALLNRADEVIE
jgi:putative tryptophan/tyrosine transport system substrate-binding protein